MYLNFPHDTNNYRYFNDEQLIFRFSKFVTVPGHRSIVKVEVSAHRAGERELLIYHEIMKVFGNILSTFKIR